MPDLFIDHCFIYQLPFWLKIQFVITHCSKSQRYPSIRELGQDLGGNYGRCS